jgi:hypothetical protein
VKRLGFLGLLAAASSAECVFSYTVLQWRDEHGSLGYVSHAIADCATHPGYGFTAPMMVSYDDVKRNPKHVQSLVDGQVFQAKCAVDEKAKNGCHYGRALRQYFPEGVQEVYAANAATTGAVRQGVA